MNQELKDLDDDAIAAMVDGIDIPPQPKVLLDFNAARNQSNPDLHAIANIVAQDVGIAAAVLKTVNSPLYGLVAHVNSIQQAVVILGLKNISHLITGYSLRNSIRGHCAISVERFWDSAADIALISANLAQRLNTAIDADEAYMVGLFIDCGIPILACRYPDYKELLVASEASGCELVAAEFDRYNTNHAVVGYYTSRSWGLGTHIRQAILGHHDPSLLLGAGSEPLQIDLLAILKLAEVINCVVRRRPLPSDWEQIKSPVLVRLGIDESELAIIEQEIGELLHDN